jgi:hypothetical protein
LRASEGLDDDQMLRCLLADGQDLLGRPLGATVRYMLEHLDGYRDSIRVQRYDRCPDCEQRAPCDIRKGGQ